jgi:hypothetical protein
VSRAVPPSTATARNGLSVIERCLAVSCKARLRRPASSGAW